MISNRVVIYLHIWRGPVSVVWRQVDAWMFGAIYRTSQSPQKWLFHGKFATVGVVCDDLEITREIALKIASDMALGKNVEYHTNLDKCITTKTTGEPINPRQ